MDLVFDLDWFDMETKTRQIVQELLNTTIVN